jgi:hypothetical protein
MNKGDVTFQEKLNELRMNIPHPNRRGQVFVLVEGDSDIRLFGKLLSSDNCNVESIPGGKFKLEEAVENLLHHFERQTDLIIGIRDADFIKLNGQPYDKSQMFLTDYHDMEIMLLADKAVFKDFLFEYTRLGADQHAQLKEDIFHTIRYIGYLQWLNDQEDLRLKFESGFVDLIKFDDKDIDLQKHTERVISKSGKKEELEPTTLINQIKELEQNHPDIDMLQLTSGHDILKTLATYFNQKHEGKGLKEEMLASTLRVRFTIECFQKTALYAQLKQWFDQHNITM